MRNMSELKPKEKEFVKEYVASNENGTATAQKVYKIEDEDYAGVKAHRLISKDKIKTEIEKVKQTIAERIPDDLLVEKNIALLNKMETIITKGEDGKTTVIESDQIDARAVAKGLDIAHRVKGNYAPEGAVNVNVNINPILVKFVNGTETNNQGDTDTI